MLRYLPPFILHHYQHKELNGSMKGFVLLADIENFTKISSSLQKRGKQGAEELSRFLEFAFTEPIKIVKQYGGFVSLFAGDAFCSIFPNSDSQSILSSVHAIDLAMKNKAIFQTSFGEFDLSLRLTVVYGDIDWRIFENDVQNEYAFLGETIQELAELSFYKKPILFSEKAAVEIGKSKFEKNEIGFDPTFDDNISFSGKPIQYNYSENMIEKFVQNRLQKMAPENEIRLAAYCFANLGGIESDKLESAIKKLEELAVLFGGYVNKLDASDKGLIAILLFGLPRSEGNTLERICRFALDSVKFIPELALGITSGSVFAGYTGSGETSEYTAFGYPMNLAARLMSKARTGEILADTYLWQELHPTFEFDYLGAISLKGLDVPIRYYQLKKRLESNLSHQENRFLGREGELVFIQSCIKENLEKQQNCILYLSGDAGVGKSRLAKEALIPFQTGNYQIFHSSCDPILKTPLEPIKQLVRAYFYYNPQLPETAGIAMFKGLWSALAQGDEEMMRIESFIASLLGYEWENSIWSLLPDDEKPTQLKFAFLRFMEKVVQTKPVILRLDDAQWLDEDSKSWLQFVSAKKVTPFIVITPCRYAQNGKKVDLQLQNHKRIDVELTSLNPFISNQLIATIMRLQEVPAATSEFIYQRSMGNPLFIEQLTAYVMESGKVDEKGSIKSEVENISLFSISDIISSRIDRLAKSVRECVAMASVLGMKFYAFILSKMVNQTVYDELSSGKNNRIWNDIDEFTYIFTHVLIKDVIYNRMLTEKLQRLHRLAGEALEDFYSDTLDENAEEIALHYEKGKSNLKAAEFFLKAGIYYHDKYALNRAENSFHKALELHQEMHGIEHIETASVINEIASLYQTMGKLEEAEKFYLQTLKIKRKKLGEKHPEIALTMNDLATLYQEMEQFKQAESLLKKALAIEEKTTDENDKLTATTLNNLGYLYFCLEKDELAELYYQKGLSINQKVLGYKHPNTAMNMNNLALLYATQGNFEKADSLYLEAIKIIEETLGKEHPDLATSLNNLALLRFHQQKYDLAEPLYRQALLIFEKILGSEHVKTVTTLNNVGVLLFKKKEYEEAELCYQKTLCLRRQIFGENHPETAISLNNLALLYAETGCEKKAESYFLQTITMRKKILGENHSDTKKAEKELIAFYKKNGPLKKAEKWHVELLDTQ